MVSNSFFEYCKNNNKLLLGEWDYSKNLKPPYEYMPNSGKKFGGFVLRNIIGRQLLIVEHVVTGVSIALDKL